MRTPKITLNSEMTTTITYKIDVKTVGGEFIARVFWLNISEWELCDFFIHPQLDVIIELIKVNRGIALDVSKLQI